jgi:cell division protein FtsB
MSLIESFKKKKFLLFSIFLSLYIGINLIGGERGLISYFDKTNTYEELIEEEKILTAKLKDLDHKISLINNNDPDYLDMLYRQKFNYVTKDEIIIKLK